MMSGRYERHLRKVRKIYLARRNALLTALAEHFGSGETTSHPAGMHLVWRIPDGLPGATEIETIARRKRIGVTTLQSGAAVHFAPDAGASRYLVFGFAGLSEREIERGISMLRAALGAKRAAIVR